MMKHNQNSSDESVGENGLIIIAFAYDEENQMCHTFNVVCLYLRNMHNDDHDHDHHHYNKVSIMFVF